MFFIKNFTGRKFILKFFDFNKNKRDSKETGKGSGASSNKGGIRKLAGKFGRSQENYDISSPFVEDDVSPSPAQIPNTQTGKESETGYFGEEAFSSQAPSNLTESGTGSSGIEYDPFTTEYIQPESISVKENNTEIQPDTDENPFGVSFYTLQDGELTPTSSPEQPQVPHERSVRRSRSKGPGRKGSNRGRRTGKRKESLAAKVTALINRPKNSISKSAKSGNNGSRSQRVSPKTILYSLFGLVVLVAATVLIVTSILNRPPEEPEEEPIVRNETNTVIDLPDVENNYNYKKYSFESSALIDYTGPIEVVTINPVIAFPEKAFDGSSTAKEYDSQSLTAGEFAKVLQSMYDKGYLIVNVSDVWSEYTAEDGSVRMRQNTLRIPENRIPVILVYENMNYDLSAADGYIEELVVSADGEIWGKYVDENGTTRLSQSLDAITILDKFVEAHPDFSYNGAKGCIALTGDNGILGFKTQSNPDSADMTERNSEITALAPVLSQLKNTGWYFACQTYSYIDVNNTEYTSLVSDMTKWVDEVGSLVGETKILVYPNTTSEQNGTVLESGDTFDYLYSLGFRVFVNSGSSSSLTTIAGGSVALCTSLTLDGNALRWNGDSFSNMFDASSIYDSSVRPSYGTSFSQQSSSQQTDTQQGGSQQDEDE